LRFGRGKYLVHLAIGVLIIWPVYRGVKSAYLHPDARLQDYRIVGEYLFENTPADTRVGLIEVGIVGYYSKRFVIDFAGLVQPEVGLVLGPEAGYEEAARWALLHYQPEFIVINPDWFSRLVHTPAFQDRCRAVHRWDSVECCGGKLLLYQCELTPR
jgi:hypothetical protein